jgi:hypothetical protein
VSERSSYGAHRRTIFGAVSRPAAEKNDLNDLDIWFAWNLGIDLSPFSVPPVLAFGAAAAQHGNLFISR